MLVWQENAKCGVQSSTFITGQSAEVSYVVEHGKYLRLYEQISYMNKVFQVNARTQTGLRLFRTTYPV